jgi:RNA polymerase sigma-70 factor (ECF subfamily)
VHLVDQSAVAVAGLGDEDAVHAAYVAHGGELYRFVLRGLGDCGAAQDVVQETFLRAWRAADRFDPELASLRVWLFAIARNAMLDHARAAGVRPWQGNLVDPPTAEAVSGAVDDPTDRLLRSWVVEEALRRVSEEHRTAIVQTHLLERPYAEVAGELGVPIGTLRSRVFYGLKALRVAMDEMGVTP